MEIKMNKQMYDSLTEREKIDCQEYFAHKEPMRHTTGCDACDEEQKLTGRTNAMCKICERQMLAEEGNR